MISAASPSPPTPARSTALPSSRSPYYASPPSPVLPFRRPPRTLAISHTEVSAPCTSSVNTFGFGVASLVAVACVNARVTHGGGFSAASTLPRHPGAKP